LTPHWLVWAVSGTITQAAVLSAQLRDVTVQDYAQTQFAKMIPDSGIQVSGRFTDVSENGSAFIGLEDNATGRKFKELVLQAAQDAKK
jgi:ligand-binding SRPBCC domain-containing protein